MKDDQILERLGDARRLAEVARTGWADSPPEEEFDRLTRLAARVLGVPATFIALVERERDFYKSHFGFGEPLASVRQLEGRTFCHYAVSSSRPLVIGNTERDPVYRDVPTVRTLGVRAYLGIPLIIEGQAIGSFCAIDFEPRDWSDLDVEVMTELATSTLRELKLRQALA
ncbi:MAG TPA: GAF domain-containing protein [Xanthomonadaceae bacterium]|nr:GAF domain-containing protein [Xanthomonadaceae bacterium]